MRKKPDYNDIVLREMPPVFRDATRITNHDLGILDVMIHGETEITAKDLEWMKEKLGYIFDGIRVSTYVDKSLKGNIEIQDEDDVSPFLLTLVAFRDYQAPSLENDGQSDRKVLHKMKPQQTETGFGQQGSVCSDRSIGPDHHQGDDKSR